MAAAPRGSVLLLDVEDADAVAAGLAIALPGVEVHVGPTPRTGEGDVIAVLACDLRRPVTVVGARAAAPMAVAVALDPPPGVGGVVSHEPTGVDDLPPGARFRVPLMVTVGRDSPATARQAARLLRERGATTDLTAGADRPSVGDPSALVAAIRRIHPE